MAAVLLAACAPAGPDGAGHPLGAEAARWVALEADAQVAAGRADWRGMREALEAKVALYPAVPAPGEGGAALRTLRALDLYNLACARALDGAGPAALDALARSLEDAPDLVGPDHVLADPDLLSLRDDPALRALLSARGAPWQVLPDPPGAPSTGAPLAVLLEESAAARDRPDASADASGGLAERLRARGFRVVRVFPPWRSPDPEAAWLPRLGGGAAAADRAFQAWRATVDPATGGGAVLVASGPVAARTAWEVLLREPEPWAAAVLEGAPPPLPALLDREEGLLQRGTRVHVVGEGSRPEAPVGAAGFAVPVAVVSSLDRGLEAAVAPERGR